MKKKFFYLLPLALILLLTSGCQKKTEDSTNSKKSGNDALEMAQKTISELEGKEAKVAFSGTIGKNEEKFITFMMHDYKDAPKDAKTLQETKDALIPLEGNIDIRIVEIGETKEIDLTHKASEGKVLKYIIYEIKGRSDNPDGNTIHPSQVYETGWDPAPQFVNIVDSDDKYASSSYSRPLLKAKDYDAPLGGPEFTTAEWQPAANVWNVSEKDDLVLAFKYIDMSGEEKFLEVQQ